MDGKSKGRAMTEATRQEFREVFHPALLAGSIPIRLDVVWRKSKPFRLPTNQQRDAAYKVWYLKTEARRRKDRYFKRHKTAQRVCMARLRAERAGKPTDKFPPRIRPRRRQKPVASVQASNPWHSKPKTVQSSGK